MSDSSITLVNDTEMVAQINSEKVLVAVPLLYVFMVPWIPSIDPLPIPSIETDKERARKGLKTQRPRQEIIPVRSGRAVQHELPAKLSDDDHHGLDYIGVCNCEPLFRLLEGDWPEVS